MRWRSSARRAIPYVVAATAGFVLSYLIVAFFVFPATIIPSDRKVPNVVGMTYDEAARRLTAVGFRAASGEQRFHASAPPGTVLEQDPPEGSVEAKGAEIVLHVSSGQRRGEVPNVVGMTRQQAELAIENAGLDVGAVEEIRSTQPRGTVSASRPVAGTRVTVPSSVTLTVSVGPASVDMPDVVGESYSRARTVLEQLGLRVGDVNVDSTSLAPGNTVISQSPAAGRAVGAGARVALTVSGRP
ncbi:MAG TPA: PASTA domain-containing protein [Gemmatimonadaceae bacterium]|nr:PASTA domain-containing protein [Gemmatimonadaceae bacterium]